MKTILVKFSFLAVAGILVFVWQAGHSKQHDWRAELKNEYGAACCDEVDCREIHPNAALRLRLGELARVGDLGLTPVNAIHPTQDGRSWMCTTGCLFRQALN